MKNEKLIIRIFQRLLEKKDINKNDIEDDEEILVDENELSQVAPPGMENVVKALKKNKNIDNPWAVAWAMYNKKQKA